MKNAPARKPVVCAVLVHAREVDKLVKFYRDVCEIPLEAEGDTGHRYYACQIRDVYFALHPAPRKAPHMSQGYRVAFAIEDFDAFIDRLKKKGVKVHMESIDMEFGKVASFLDPENNMVEVISLSRSWLDKISELTRKRQAVRKR